MIELNKNNRS